MSFAYKQAAGIIQDFWNKKASLKTLVYGSSFDKKVGSDCWLSRVGLSLRFMQQDAVGTTSTG